MSLIHLPTIDRRVCSQQAMFEEAIQQSLQHGLGAGRLWYPYSYAIAMLARRTCFLAAQTSLLGAEHATSILSDTCHLRN